MKNEKRQVKRRLKKSEMKKVQGGLSVTQPVLRHAWPPWTGSHTACAECKPTKLQTNSL